MLIPKDELRPFLRDVFGSLLGVRSTAQYEADWEAPFPETLVRKIVG